MVHFLVGPISNIHLYIDHDEIYKTWKFHVSIFFRLVAKWFIKKRRGSGMVAESDHLKNFFSKKIYLPKSFILTKSAAETDHEKIFTAEIAHFLKIWHVAETVHFWWPKLFIWKKVFRKNSLAESVHQKILDCRNRSYCNLLCVCVRPQTVTHPKLSLESNREELERMHHISHSFWGTLRRFGA